MSRLPLRPASGAAARMLDLFHRVPPEWTFDPQFSTYLKWHTSRKAA
jgi:hypothetical protein